MKRKKVQLLTGLLILCMGLTACSVEDVKFKIAELTGATYLDNEEYTQTAVIDMNYDVITDEGGAEGIYGDVLEEDITASGIPDNCLLIEHNDSYYQGIWQTLNYDAYEDEVGDTVNKNRQMYFTTDGYSKIPTLYLGNEDKLLFYSKNNLLDYIYWERFEDLGYTIGLYNIEKMESGRVYITLPKEKDDPSPIIDGGGLEGIETDATNLNIYLSKIGHADFTGDLIEDGLVANVESGVTYDLETYDGTYYHHYNAQANIRAFQDMEQFCSIEYEPLQSYLYEIKVPDYLMDGYYCLTLYSPTGVVRDGIIRIVRGSAYVDDPDNFNVPLLEYTLDEEEVAALEEDYQKKKEYEETKDYPGRYSPYKNESGPLQNHYKTMVEGSFGWVDPNAMEEEDTEVAEEEQKKTILKTALVKTFPIKFPYGKQCSVRIRTDETTGEAFLITSESTKKNLDYNRIEGYYQAQLSGHDETLCLVVSGLWRNYDIELVNAYQGEEKDIAYAYEAKTADIDVAEYRDVEKSITIPSTAVQTTVYVNFGDSKDFLPKNDLVDGSYAYIKFPVKDENGDISYETIDFEMQDDPLAWKLVIDETVFNKTERAKIKVVIHTNTSFKINTESKYS